MAEGIEARLTTKRRTFNDLVATTQCLLLPRQIRGKTNCSRVKVASVILFKGRVNHHEILMYQTHARQPTSGESHVRRFAFHHQGTPQGAAATSRYLLPIAKSRSAYPAEDKTHLQEAHRRHNQRIAEGITLCSSIHLPGCLQMQQGRKKKNAPEYSSAPPPPQG